MEVLEISLEGIVRVNYPIVLNSTNSITKTTEIVNFQSQNSFIVIGGCNLFALVKFLDGSVITGCILPCVIKTKLEIQVVIASSAAKPNLSIYQCIRYKYRTMKNASIKICPTFR